MHVGAVTMSHNSKIDPDSYPKLLNEIFKEALTVNVAEKIK